MRVYAVYCSSDLDIVYFSVFATRILAEKAMKSLYQSLFESGFRKSDIVYKDSESFSLCSQSGHWAKADIYEREIIEEQLPVE